MTIQRNPDSIARMEAAAASARESAQMIAADNQATRLYIRLQIASSVVQVVCLVVILLTLAAR